MGCASSAPSSRGLSTVSDVAPSRTKIVGGRRYVRYMSDDRPPERSGDEEPDASDAPKTDLCAREDAVSATLDRVGALQREICRRQAEQAELVATFVQQRNGLDAELGVSMSPGQYRSLIAEVSIACNLSIMTAQSFTADCFDLATKHPFTLAALREGRVNITCARAVARETRLLADDAMQALADQVIAEEVGDVVPSRMRNLIERRVIEVDPDAAARKAVTERADRHIAYSPGVAGTAYLNAYLPAEQAAACWHALDGHARTLRAAGDARSISHLMCDTLVQRLTGTHSLNEVKVHLNLTMSDATLFGLDDRPGELVGCGPVPAPIARLIATTGNTWVKRLYTDPVDATLTTADTKRRRFDGALRDFIRARDQHCRGIHCAAPIRDIDHIVEHSRGGATKAGNAQGMSKNCHTTREHPHMQLDFDAETGVVAWMTPTKQTYRSLPPPAGGAGATTDMQRRYRTWMLHPPPSSLEQNFVRRLIRHQRQRQPADDSLSSRR